VRKNFTVEEIAEIDQFYRSKEESASQLRQKKGKQVSENFAKGRSSSKIAARVGISDRHLEKIRVCRSAFLQDPTSYADIWNKVATGRMKVDKGYNQVKRFQRIKEAEKLPSSIFPSSNNSFELHLGSMQELGRKISSNSIDLIFTDPPYGEEYLHLYVDLAKLAVDVLKDGTSLITFVGHHNIFKINQLLGAHTPILKYHWLIIVRHNGSLSRVHQKRVWPHYKPLLFSLF
jgi:hypothetical protein